MKKTLAIAVLGVPAVLAGCAGTTGDRTENYPELSLGWARLLTEKVRDAELPPTSPVWLPIANNSQHK
jgi:hypothetical protein